MPLKGGFLFYANIGKTNSRAYLFVFIFRNTKLRHVVTYMFHLDAWGHNAPLWHNFLERKKMSKRRNLGSICREGSGNARSSVLWAISLLNYAWNDATCIALRSRESTQEVTHFRYRSRRVYSSFHILFQNGNESSISCVFWSSLKYLSFV